jgi:hypothetical protein
VQYAFLSFLVVSIVVALATGGPPEKWGGVALLVMAAVQFAGTAMLGARFDQLDPVAFTVDLVGFAAFGAIALYARRIWPLWASALQLFSLTTHFVRIVDGLIHPGVYWLMKSAPTWGICLMLIVASVLYRRRVSRMAQGASWRVWRGSRAPKASTPTNPRS